MAALAHIEDADRHALDWTFRRNRVEAEVRARNLPSVRRRISQLRYRVARYDHLNDQDIDAHMTEHVKGG